MKITKEQYQEAYRCARLVHDEPRRMRVVEAKARLQRIGLNGSSAMDFIYIFRKMLAGEVYKRAMSVEATEDFIRWIRRDYGQESFRNALAALALHIPYKGGPMPGYIRVLEKYRAEVPPPAKTNAIDDLSEPPMGNERPDRAKRVSYVVERDEKLRRFVVKRSMGRCEYCGEMGFLLVGGQNYVEAHHVISLGKDGRDTLENVIALCPNHHPEAHYGAKPEQLESELIVRLDEILRPKRPNKAPEPTPTSVMPRANEGGSK